MASSGGVNTIHIANSWFTLDMEQTIWWKGQELTGVVNQDLSQWTQGPETTGFLFTLFPSFNNSHLIQEGKILSKFVLFSAACPALKRVEVNEYLLNE